MRQRDQVYPLPAWHREICCLGVLATLYHRPLSRLQLNVPQDQESALGACRQLIRVGPPNVQGQWHGRQVGSLAVSSGQGWVHCHPPDNSGNELCLKKQPYRLFPAYTGSARLWDTRVYMGGGGTMRRQRSHPAGVRPCTCIFGDDAT